ncbi:hypothetical protein HanRHA438_Chr03g0106671 [Helianthus annuus]|uniref:Uncharacterized protein n=1 Tax=Helianthus annuus TaxID=4232 RepID=A0A251V7Y7_HELAN|nr:hypothetical protein HanXRQr2_Chr03g0095591 [Helianthus annuus]KAJ0599394.1 hypothetical protein HanIR_Chr03g0104361 [Helianthus annuus]KAJ0934373.1 hypothetical protein HanRHA438_Chr03g0106671 [Helianthus annuus]KAJ0942459.1 hypothetical protein HanPSC8_Chr03g0092191 [Helianthus annuus]
MLCRLFLSPNFAFQFLKCSIIPNSSLKRREKERERETRDFELPTHPQFLGSSRTLTKKSIVSHNRRCQVPRLL